MNRIGQGRRLAVENMSDERWWNNETEIWVKWDLTSPNPKQHTTANLSDNEVSEQYVSPTVSNPDLDQYINGKITKSMLLQNIHKNIRKIRELNRKWACLFKKLLENSQHKDEHFFILGILQLIVIFSIFMFQIILWFK